MKKKYSIVGIIFFAILLLSKIDRISDAIQLQQLKDQRENPNAILNCLACPQGIPIYDSWSIDRKIMAYAADGEECEVRLYYSSSYSQTLEPNAKYKYYDYEPHLFVRCQNKSGFIYAKHAKQK